MRSRAKKKQEIETLEKQIEDLKRANAAVEAENRRLTEENRLHEQRFRKQNLQVMTKTLSEKGKPNDFLFMEHTGQSAA